MCTLKVFAHNSFWVEKYEICGNSDAKMAQCSKQLAKYQKRKVKDKAIAKDSKEKFYELDFDNPPFSNVPSNKLILQDPAFLLYLVLLYSLQTKKRREKPPNLFF